MEFVWHGVEFERGTANAISRTIKVQTLTGCRNRSCALRIRELAPLTEQGEWTHRRDVHSPCADRTHPLQRCCQRSVRNAH